MNADAKDHDLIYVADYEGQDVTIYGWRSAKLLGTLSCFYQPTGLCVDHKQNVYVTDFDTGNTSEFAHGGTTVIGTLKDTIGYPWDCAVDRKTGNVAVVNLYDWMNGPVPGSVLIYPHGEGTPIVYRADLQYYYNATYDETGDLYVTGINRGGIELWRLRSGTGRLENIGLGQSFQKPGGAHWDGEYLVLGDAGTNTLYRFSVVGSYAGLVGTIPLNETGRIYQFSLPKFGRGNSNPEPRRLIAVDWDTDQLFKWSYPSVGSPRQEYVTGMSEPDAVVVSKAR